MPHNHSVLPSHGTILLGRCMQEVQYDTNTKVPGSASSFYTQLRHVETYGPGNMYAPRHLPPFRRTHVWIHSLCVIFTWLSNLFCLLPSDAFAFLVAPRSSSYLATLPLLATLRDLVRTYYLLCFVFRFSCPCYFYCFFYPPADGEK